MQLKHVGQYNDYWYSLTSFNKINIYKKREKRKGVGGCIFHFTDTPLSVSTYVPVHKHTRYRTRTHSRRVKKKDIQDIGRGVPVGKTIAKI
jgi:hypothetical protein